MKAGAYCGYSLGQIIKIKQNEEKRCGIFFWGYGGVFCRPDTVSSFVSYANARSRIITVLFSETVSEFTVQQPGRFISFSQDRVSWSPLDKRVLLVGNLNVPHFAIIARNLRKINGELNLRDYILFAKKNMLFDTRKRLDNYYRYRVDKVCGSYCPSNTEEGRVINVSYAANLVSPYCVYVK